MRLVLYTGSFLLGRSVELNASLGVTDALGIFTELLKSDKWGPHAMLCPSFLFAGMF